MGPNLSEWVGEWMCMHTPCPVGTSTPVHANSERRNPPEHISTPAQEKNDETRQNENKNKKNVSIRPETSIYFYNPCVGAMEGPELELFIALTHRPHK